MELIQRIALAAAAAAALYVSGLLTYLGMTEASLALAALGTFALGLLAATRA